MDPGGGDRGDASPPPPDSRLVKEIPQIHAQFVENESKMSKIMRYPLTPEISGSTPDFAPAIQRLYTLLCNVI